VLYHLLATSQPLALSVSYGPHVGAVFHASSVFLHLLTGLPDDLSASTNVAMVNIVGYFVSLADPVSIIISRLHSRTSFSGAGTS
jgi:hypothetical protein